MSNWIPDRQDWLDNKREGVVERHLREMGENKATTDAAQHLSSIEDARKLILDDDGIAVLANAVLLAWHLPNPRADVLSQRQNYSELYDLRECLRSQGTLDDLFNDPNEFHDDPPLEAIVAVRKRINDQFTNPVRFAHLRIKDLVFLPEQSTRMDVKAMLLNASDAEFRLQIPRLGRCNLTLMLKALVLDHYQKPFPRRLNGQEAVGKGGPIGREGRSKEKQACEVLKNFGGVLPESRMTKADVFCALGGFGFSKKAKQRIWDSAAPEHWKVSGRVAGSANRLDFNELVSALKAGIRI